MSKYIEFSLGSEKRIKVSSAGRSGSLFYESYRQALAGVIEIIQASTAYTQGKDCISMRGTGECCRDKGAACARQSYSLLDDKDYYNYPNNMVVFTGGRGTGKSSAMLTFVDSLTDPHSEIFKKDFLREVVNCELPGLVEAKAPEQTVDVIYNLMGKSKFVSLTPIDPTMLETDGQILVNILARMFQKAEAAWEEHKPDRGDRLELNEKNELMHQFTVCYECANALKNKKDARQALDPLDLLSSLGDSSNLKRQLVRLVDKLLRFVHRESRDDTYLVLQIDDTDMNIQQAYAILEDIRKYLVIPRLIIVMAADLEHLSQVVEGNLRSSYGAIGPDAGLHTRSIASQYISKLVPQSRRVCLPELEVYLKEHPDTEIRYSAPAGKVLPDGSPFPDSQEQIFRLIYRKTGMIFLRQEHHLHYIIPGNMRLLGHFLAMLVQMQDVADPGESNVLGGAGFFLIGQGEEKRTAHLRKLQARLQNVQRFRDYFLEIWAENALSTENARTLRELAEANLSNKARIAFGSNGKADRRPGYVDMIRRLRQKERDAAAEEDSRYIYAVHTLFSLLAHSIVLEELIAHYSSPSWAETDCVFKRLYPLFGSRPFSYLQKDRYQLSGFHILYRSQATWYPAEDNSRDVPMGEGMNVVLIPDSNYQSYWFPIRWRVPPNMDMPSSLQRTKANPRFLYSMFCPYKLPEEASEIWGDLCTPIANCLYLSPSEYSSPLARAAVAAASHTSAMEPDKWPEVQSSALLVVLNWDVQRVMGERLMSKVRFPDWTIAENQFDLISGVAAFYTYLTSSFRKKRILLNTKELTGEELNMYKEGHSGQSQAPVEPSLPVACLENLDLTQWLFRLDENQLLKKDFKKGSELDSGDQLTEKELQLLKRAQADWISVVNQFYPMTESANSDGVNHSGRPESGPKDPDPDQKKD